MLSQLSDSRGYTHGRAAQVEAWSKAHAPALCRAPLMLMMRALWVLPKPTQKLAKHRLAPQSRLRVPVCS